MLSRVTRRQVVRATRRAEVKAEQRRAQPNSQQYTTKSQWTTPALFATFRPSVSAVSKTVIRQSLANKQFAWSQQQRRGFLEVFKNLPLEQGISKEGQISLSHAKVGVAADKRSAVGVIEAEKALANSISAFGPHVYPFYLIIHMYSKMKMQAEAEQKFAQMKSLGLKPNTDIYNALLEMYIWTQKEKDIQAITEQIFADKAFDTITVRLLLTHAFVAGDESVTAAEMIWVRFKQAGFQPTQMAYQALCEIYLAARYDLKLLTLWKEMEANGYPEKIAYIEPHNWERLVRCEIGVDPLK